MPIEIKQTVSSPRYLYKINEVPKLAEFSFLTVSSLRHHIYKSKPRCAADGTITPGNGMKEAGVIIRIGKRILIDTRKLRIWLEKPQPENLTMDIR